MIDHLNPAPEEEVAGKDGLSQDGDPEVEVIEEGDSSDAEATGVRPRVLRAPRALLPRRRSMSIWPHTFPMRRGVTYA